MSELTDQDERDFYWSLLNLGSADDLEALLESALGLVVRVAGAERGYLELRAEGTLWSTSTALGTTELEVVRSSLSSGIIHAAVSRGETVRTASAVQDARFSAMKSVQYNQIEAAVCVPVGSPALGVVYLQGTKRRGPFSEEAIDRIELFAKHLAPYADRLVQRHVLEEVDPTLPWRRRLQADALVGRSPALAAMLQQVAVVAPLDLAVLLNGPTGTGKTLVARVIHENSPRASEPFVELNCAALPADLLENELFGAEKGAHSAAMQKVLGKVGAAGKGTLFLDEVGELPMLSQAKLLQLLQSGEYWPLGASRPEFSEARIVAATNLDLKTAVAEKKFRSDLYYRLNVFSIEVPGLAERGDDVLLLAEKFLKDAVADHGLAPLRLGTAVRHEIATMTLVGHIRELSNLVHRGAVLASADGSKVVQPAHLFPGAVASFEGPTTYQEHLRAFQSRLLRRTLREVRGNVSEAARRLDMARSHLYTLIREHGLRRNE